MNITRVFAAFFSPTHGTKRYVEAIAQRLAPSFEVIDLTRPEVRQKEYRFTDSDLVIFGAPVYAGRLPMVENGIFDRLHGDRTPAVFTVSYGNREFEDALLEEKELCEANGFVGIAASAWIAPHTFSARIAAGRPDEHDLAQVAQFAAKVEERLKGELGAPSLSVPGNHPYREVNGPMPFYPEGNERCVLCGACASACPTGAIPLSEPNRTDPAKCIRCLACARACPTQARDSAHPALMGVREKLEGMLLNVRKEPAFFF